MKAKKEMREYRGMSKMRGAMKKKLHKQLRSLEIVVPDPCEPIAFMSGIMGNVIYFDVLY